MGGRNLFLIVFAILLLLLAWKAWGQSPGGNFGILESSGAGYVDGDGETAGDIDMVGFKLYDSTTHLNLGAAVTSSRSLMTGDVGIQDDLEINGVAYLDGDSHFVGNMTAYGSLSLRNNVRQYFGSTFNYTLFYDSAATSFIVRTTNSDGAGTDADVITIDDGTDDVAFAGDISVGGISGDGSGKAVCIKADGNLGTCSDAVGAGGTCTCG